MNLIKIKAELPEQKRAQLQPLSAWQVRKVLTQFNLRTKVETAISPEALTPVPIIQVGSGYGQRH
jgi:hypothetical protein